MIDWWKFPWIAFQTEKQWMKLSLAAIKVFAIDAIGIFFAFTYVVAFLQTNLSTTSCFGSVWNEKQELYYFQSVWIFSFYLLPFTWNRTPAMSSIYNQHWYFQGILNNVTSQCARCRYVNIVNQARFLIYTAKDLTARICICYLMIRGSVGFMLDTILAMHLWSWSLMTRGQLLQRAMWWVVIPSIVYSQIPEIDVWYTSPRVKNIMPRPFCFDYHVLLKARWFIWSYY